MDWLKCNICFNTFNEVTLRPRSLNCGHSFCEKCINTAIQNKTLTCPQCRKVHELNSAVELPINFIVEGLLKSLFCGSQNASEGAISSPLDGGSDTDDDKSEIHGSLKSLLEQQEKSLASQKEFLKKSAGICYEHPSKECLLRCSVHKCWVCEECIEEQGEHPKDICQIKFFSEEIEDRRQEHKSSLDNEGKFCDETISLIENHISYLKDEREQHISLVNRLQDIINMHKKEEENLQNEIYSYEKIIEDGKNIKKMLSDVEITVLNAASLDESNAARDMVKSKNAAARSWGQTSQRDVNEGKMKVKMSSHLAVATRKSLDYRKKIEVSELKLEKEINESSEGIEELIKKTKLREIEDTRHFLNRVTHLYEDELNDIATSKRDSRNIWDIVIKIQLIFQQLISKNCDKDVGDEDDDDEDDDDEDDDDKDDDDEDDDDEDDDDKDDDDDDDDADDEDDEDGDEDDNDNYEEDEDEDRNGDDEDKCNKEEDDKVIYNGSPETTIWAVATSHEDCSVLTGKLYFYNGDLRLSSLESCDSLPRKGIALPLEKIEEYMSRPRCVYLSFYSRKGYEYWLPKTKYLGTVIISINENAPRRAQQFIDLCLGRTGSTLSGSSSFMVCNKGKHTESICCKYYINANKEYSNENLFPDLENTESILGQQGLVINDGSYHVFRILTRSESNSYIYQGAVMGWVVSGLPILQKMINDDRVGHLNYAQSMVEIVDCGLVVDQKV